MCISDWSSDVCSSDLNSAGGLQGIADITGLGLGGSNAFNGAGNAPLQPIEVAPPPSPPATGGNTAWRAELRRALPACSAENFLKARKCVVEGKSWSVRVALGGGRLL